MLGEFVGGFGTVEELEVALEPHRIPVGAVRSISEMADTAWAEQREVVTTTTHGIRVPRSPYRAAGVGLRDGVAERGADNRSVLHELLGLDDAAIDRLEGEGVLTAGG